MPQPSLNDLYLIVTGLLPQWLSIRRTFYLLDCITNAFPLIRRHRLQSRLPGRRNDTGWLKSSVSYVSDGLAPEDWPSSQGVSWGNEGGAPSAAARLKLLSDLDGICGLLESEESPYFIKSLLVLAPYVLLSPEDYCTRPHCIESNGRILLLKEKEETVAIIGPDYKYARARLVTSYCPKCDAHYHPDVTTFTAQELPRRRRNAGEGRRKQSLIADPTWYRISKHAIYAHKNVALMQKSAMKELKATWSRFHRHFNSLFGEGSTILTERQVHKLHAEQFARILLQAHNELEGFSCDAFPDPETLIKAVLEVIGVGGGIVPGSRTHDCSECLRLRQNREVRGENAPAANAHLGRFGVVGAEDEPPNDLADDERPNGIGEANPEGPMENDQDDELEQFTRAVVMDGKTLKHKICRIEDCKKPLENYKDGIFCEEHSEFNDICGIGTCQRRRLEHSMACDIPTHQQWYEAYRKRFKRLTFGEVTRIIRRTAANEQARVIGDPEAPNRHSADVPPNFPLQPLLPTGPDGEDGGAVEHRFRAGMTYGVQTIQWACGVPIGWGKLYTSESLTQVLVILNQIFPEDDKENRPSFIFYDNACKLLAHILAQHQQNWLETTRFIVDVWHYINHRVTDILCRRWCNPAPMDGSQPDLVIRSIDENGRSHTVRAYNTETAEQLNAWLNSFEAPLRLMTDYNFDFTMHILLYFYKLECDERRSDSDATDTDSVDDD